jgi:predicted nuclease of predicted toxin-antitoxin system
MSIKILIDMSLSPQWVAFLKQHEIDALHWSSVGDHGAKDNVIMQWARDNKHVIFTHDLDFGALLALTQASSPSVIQMRTQNVLPEYLGKLVASVIKKHAVDLGQGALIVLDESMNRLRILPLK